MGTDRIIRRAELLQITGVSAASIYRWVASGTFPAPMKLGPNATGWLESEVVAWLQSRERAVEVRESDTPHENGERSWETPQPPSRGEPSDESR
ncbi:MAG TPA: AlpA family phage regulatory protein [Thermoanaerobaculia bacterium]|nr:AlpA family phage regulatory protein [Thermoanaerobaculia bacterium]